MRIGLLADVHANLPALRTALRYLDVRQVDMVLVAGDLVGYGASPNECVELLVDRRATCVAGNHDLFMVGRLPGTRFAGNALRAAEVTAPLLSAETRDYLAELPLYRRVGDVVMAHGSLDDPEEYVEDRSRSVELLREMRRREPGSRTLVLGHTHHHRHVRALSVAGDGRRAQLINPGSVGQSRARESHPKVRLAILDTDDGATSFVRLPYDVEDASRRLAAIGLDDRCLHSAPPLIYRIGHRFPRPIRSRVKRLRDRVGP